MLSIARSDEETDKDAKLYIFIIYKWKQDNNARLEQHATEQIMT